MRERIRRGTLARQLEEAVTKSNALPLDDAPRVDIGGGLTGRYGSCSVAAILENPNAIRTHTKRKIKRLGRSIEITGMLSPPILDETYTILAGHARLEAVQASGAETIPVIQVFNLTEAQKRFFLLADNKIGEEAGLDRKKLAAQLPDLEALFADSDTEITDTGFEVAEFDELVVDMGDQFGDEDEAIDVELYNASSVLALGDILQLGDHGLLVGDARDPAALNALMQDELADCALLDVPYNVDARTMGGRGSIRHANFLHAFGEMERPEYVSFLLVSFKAVAERCRPGTVVYAFSDWRHVRDMIEAGEQAFQAYLNLVVWNKTNAGQGGLYRNKHELIGVFRVGDEPLMDNVQKGRFGRNRSNVWTYGGVNGFRKGRMEDLACHPTVKPTALVADALKDVTQRGDVVLDTFVGSGTTVLAAEKIGRRARAIEIDPRYAQVAARRWEAMTGRDAIHVDSGLTLDELAESRRAAPAPEPSPDDEGDAWPRPRLRRRTRGPVT